MPNSDGGTFEVTGYYEMASRGAFVLGHMRNGAIGPGMLAKTNSDPATLRISSIESLNNHAEKIHLSALIFAEKPNIGFVQHVFPVGHFIEAFARD